MKEFNDHHLEYNDENLEFHNYDEFQNIEEYNPYNEEIVNRPEINEEIIYDKKVITNRKKKEDKSQKELKKNLAKNALQMTALGIGAITTVTIASVSADSFLPELKDFIFGIYENINEPLVSKQIGMDLGDFAVLWNFNSDNNQTTNTNMPIIDDDTTNEDNTITNNDIIDNNDIDSEDNIDIDNNQDNNNIYDCNKYGHIWLNDWQIIENPTCINSGLQADRCQNCGAQRNQSINSLNHDFSSWQINAEPTCTDDGEEIRICHRCNTKENRVINAIGHDFGPYIILKEPICSNDGEKYKECKNCGETRYQTIKATGNHSYLEYTGQDGHGQICTTCNEKNIVAHTYGSFTEVDDTNHKHGCTECGFEETLAHNFNSFTSMDDLEHVQVCGDCNHEIIQSHNYGPFVYVDDNNHNRTCNDCKNVESTNHNIEYKSNGNDTHKGTCKECNEVIAVDEEHDWINDSCTKCDASITFSLQDITHVTSSGNYIGTIYNVAITGIENLDNSSRYDIKSESSDNIWADNFQAQLTSKNLVMNAHLNMAENKINVGQTYSVEYDVDIKLKDGTILFTKRFKTSFVGSDDKANPLSDIKTEIIK